MLILGALGFTFPYILSALAILPGLWFLLRVTPPPPRLIAFPPVRLLRDLIHGEETARRTPWWLILLRLLLSALLILALAGPVWRPQKAANASALLLVVVDNGWASASNWLAQSANLKRVLDHAAESGQRVALLTTAADANGKVPALVGPERASDIQAVASTLQSLPWQVQRGEALKRLQDAAVPANSEILWLSDGIDSENAAAFGEALTKYGMAQIVLPTKLHLPFLLSPPGPGSLDTKLMRADATSDQTVNVQARTNDGRVLGVAEAHLARGSTVAPVKFDLPLEIANDIDRLEIENVPSTGSVALLDSRWQRHPVGIVTNANSTNASLLSGTTYVQAALAAFADVRQGTLETLLKQPLSVIVLDDEVVLSDGERNSLQKWVEDGGLLLRFAGPHLAAQPDSLVPVPLRQGDRALGGAMSWTIPVHIASFAANSPFVGLTIPSDVTISREVLAEPSLDLSGKTWAELSDGTPLITSDRRGKGRLVLVHTSSNPEWSNLSLSGLYVDLLHRLVETSASIKETNEKIAGSANLLPLSILNGNGILGEPPATSLSIAPQEFDQIAVSPLHPPGYYGNQQIRYALNLTQSVKTLRPLLVPQGFKILAETATIFSLKPGLLALVLLLFITDMIVALRLRGLLRLALAGLLLEVCIPSAYAQTIPPASLVTTLGYVETGNHDLDQISRAGLTSLAKLLVERTSVEDATAAPVNLEADDLAFYPFLYWPLSASQPPLSNEVAAKLNHYLKAGGMILFDTRDEEFGDASGSAGVSPGSEALRTIAAKLNLPPLALITPQHVLTRSFYLLSDFPGRYDGGKLWVEQIDAQHNDGVASVLVGSNDWASAWAADEQGQPLFPVSPDGEEQREMAYRFGINLVMYALTGSYKADQVHVPFILERLGK